MKKVISIILWAIIGISVGVLISDHISEIAGGLQSSSTDSNGSILLFFVVFAAILLSYFVHIAAHEAGHLVAGLMSGYSFASFRLFSITLIKINGRIVRRKYNIVGTAGQCLMSPPGTADGAFPVILYNLGGAAMNFLLSLVTFAVLIILPDAAALASVALLVSAIIGAIIFLTNLIPLKINGIANDGYNALTLGKREKARRAFWLLLKINASVIQGSRYRDFPAEWFEYIDCGDLSDPIVASLVLMKYNYLVDKMELDEAKTLAGSMLSSPGKMLELHKNELRCELLFYELIGLCRDEEIDRQYDMKLRKYVKATSSYISRQRLLYAYAKLFLCDDDKADAALRLFEKACLKSPFSGDIEGERELVGLVDSLIPGCDRKE